MVHAIETEGLTKTYGRARGVADLDLTVPVGTVFGFLGPNGAGKTTTMRVLLDFLRPTRGRARVLGLDTHVDSVAVRRRVGYVPGELALPRRGTAREVLDWLGRFHAHVDPAYRDSLAMRFDLDLERPIHALSRGNRQKVALIQAFAHRPELLVLDEPTSGLDPLLQHEFGHLVREVTDAGATVFLSSHLLDEVEQLCERVAIVKEGRLVAVEDVADLRTRAIRDVRIRFDAPVDPIPFAALDGVSNVEVRGDTLHCALIGAADPLVKLAARHRVLEFTSAPPDLEETFLRLYGGGHDEGDDEDHDGGDDDAAGH